MMLARSSLARTLFGLLALLVILIGIPRSGLPQGVRTKEEISRTLTVENVAVRDGGVSGEVVNRGSNTVRDVQLLIRYTWLWDKETKPGKDDPGTSSYSTLPKEIAPGGRLPFSFKPSPPLANASGGHFETSVSIGGFTEVIPQTK
jgi:hypothetical protein